MTSSAYFAGRFAGVYFLLLCLPSFAADIQAPGVLNFWKVDDQVYRGAQPTETGFQSLAKLGVRTVVDLRLSDEHSKAEEQRLVEASGMKYVSLPMEGMHTPANEQVSRVMTILQDPAAGPVFLHCQRGADRTGALIACYRIGHDGWENKKALSEARSLGMSWYQVALQRYVLGYQTTPRSHPIAVAAQ
jgi:tyrosine-protein phosphatase SIW14